MSGSPRPAGDAAPPVVTAVATPTAPLEPRTVSDDARRCYLEARQFAAQKSPLTIFKAIASYERAIALSPEYAEAHSGLGFALCQAVVYVAYPGIAAWPRAKAHASAWYRRTGSAAWRSRGLATSRGRWRRSSWEYR